MFFPVSVLAKGSLLVGLPRVIPERSRFFNLSDSECRVLLHWAYEVSFISRIPPQFPKVFWFQISKWHTYSSFGFQVPASKRKHRVFERISDIIMWFVDNFHSWICDPWWKSWDQEHEGWQSLHHFRARNSRIWPPPFEIQTECRQTL